MQPFEQYLTEQNLEALTVSIKAKVRYATVYNAIKGKPITAEHAQQLRRTVFLMTGIPYTGELPVLEAVEDMPTIPIRKIPHPRTF